MKKPPLLERVTDAVDEIKGVDVRVLDVQKLTTITDYMVLCTGTSNRHVKSIADNVVQRAKEHGFRPLGVEGLDAAEWVLVDLGDVVVHVMQAQTRAFYQLEKLWDVPPPEDEPARKPAKKPKAARKPRKSAASRAGAKRTSKPRRR